MSCPVPNPPVTLRDLQEAYPAWEIRQAGPWVSATFILPEFKTSYAYLDLHRLEYALWRCVNVEWIDSFL